MNEVLEKLNTIEIELKKIDSIEATLQELVNRVENIEKVLEIELPKVKDSCANMDDHISFVEGVYTTIQKPFQRLLPPISRMLRITNVNAE